MKINIFKTNNLKQGDFVLRFRRRGHTGDCFKCHALSFGQFIEYQTESTETRPDTLPLCDVGDKWTECVITPFNPLMAPQDGDGYIQWVPQEFIRIPAWLYCILGFLWPLLRLFDTRPCDGRSTDW